MRELKGIARVTSDAPEEQRKAAAVISNTMSEMERDAGTTGDVAAGLKIAAQDVAQQSAALQKEVGAILTSAPAA